MYELFKLVGAGPTHLISDYDLGSDMNQVINIQSYFKILTIWYCWRGR